MQRSLLSRGSLGRTPRQPKLVSSSLFCLGSPVQHRPCDRLVFSQFRSKKERAFRTSETGRSVRHPCCSLHRLLQTLLFPTSRIGRKLRGGTAPERPRVREERTRRVSVFRARSLRCLAGPRRTIATLRRRLRTAAMGSRAGGGV